MSDLNEAETPQQEPEKQQDAAVPVKLPGAELAVLRQQSGMTVEQLAARLKLTPRQILALEADNYAALPGMAIVRGFIRAYAKVLKVDPAPLVALIQDEKTPEVRNLAPTWRGVSTPYSETRLPTLGRRGAASRGWLLAVLLIVLLIGVLVGARQMGWLPNLSRVEMLQNDKVPAASSASVAVMKDAEHAGAVSVASEEPGRLVRQELPPITSAQVLPATEDNLAGKPGTNPAEVTSAANNVEPAAPVNAANALVLKCREPSWFEIRRANGTVVRSGLLQAGTAETIEIAEPVQLTLGNAPGVDVTFRGVPLEIRLEDGNKVAKVNVK